jgi:hypothetical protein
MMAADKALEAIAYPVSKISVNSWNSLLATSQTRTISTGASKTAVLSWLGKPAQELSSNVFLYDNCAPDQSVALERGCNTLVITFAEGKVADLKFVNGSAKMVIAENVQRPSDRNIGSALMLGRGQEVAEPNK